MCTDLRFLLPRRILPAFRTIRAASNVTPTTRKRRALLVGITYCYPSNKWSPLQDTHHDVNRFLELLINTYDYLPEDVCVLKDGPDFPDDLQPTRVNIIRELKRLVSGAMAGDKLTFLYSGHVDQIEAIDDLENESGMDGMIIPSDEQPIISDELTEILVPIPAIFDASHSGTILGLPHHHCNSVYVPWQSKGKRRTMIMQNINVRRQAADFNHSIFQVLQSVETVLDSQPVEPPSCQIPPDGTQVGGGVTDQSGWSSEAQFRVNRHSEEVSLFACQPRCASPEPRFVCDGWCEYSDIPHPMVISLSACSDLQVAWEGPNGSLTTALCDYLKTNNHPTYKALMSHINHKLHDNAMALHEYTYYQRKKVARGEGNGFDGDLDNFQEPELSSLVKLNMDDTLQL
ncbi:caspase domain-containing protein [Lactifluus volemus]|nr:caspase domain-containing protein [Lactifluus volemus]